MLSEVREPPWYHKNPFPFPITPTDHLLGLRKLTVSPARLFPHLAPRAGSLHWWCWAGQMGLDLGDLKLTSNSHE